MNNTYYRLFGNNTASMAALSIICFLRCVCIAVITNLVGVGSHIKLGHSILSLRAVEVEIVFIYSVTFPIPLISHWFLSFSRKYSSVTGDEVIKLLIITISHIFSVGWSDSSVRQTRQSDLPQLGQKLNGLLVCAAGCTSSDENNLFLVNPQHFKVKYEKTLRAERCTLECRNRRESF